MRSPSLKPRRILCIGNPFAGGDGAGPAVFERLSRTALPEGVGVVDGGLGGLNLLAAVEGAERVVFVDTMSGFGPPEEIVVLDGLEAMRGIEPSFGHDDGLAFLLKALPLSLDPPLPGIRLAGLPPGASTEALDRLAAAAIELAAEESETR